MNKTRKLNPLVAIAGALVIGLIMTGCQSADPVSSDQNISFEAAMSHVDSLDKGGRWLSLGIQEINGIGEISEDDKILINHHLFTLIEDKDLRFDKDLHDQFITEIRSEGVSEDAVAVVERAHIRVSSPLNLHDGYWVAKMEMPGAPMKMTVINDMHVDAATGRVTVYAQSLMMGKVMAPAQIGPGEFAELPNGDPVGFHPNAVYLNGSGEELAEDDGTGAWWVKHSWELGGEGYYNWELKPQEHYGEGLWVEGFVLEDGLTMKIGDVEGRGYNTRKPIIDGNSVNYEVVRFGTLTEGETEPGNSSEPEEQFTIEWKHKNEKSALNGLARSEPDVRVVK